MPNTIAGINLAQIAQKTLTLLTPRLTALTNITTDFSEDLSDKGETVTTRIATSMTPDDVSGGFTISDSASTPYTIPLNKELGKAIGFTQTEISKGGMGMLERVFLPAAVSAVTTGVYQEFIKPVTAANFPTEKIVTSASFDADFVTDRATDLTTRNVPNFYRYGLLIPTYFGALCKDNAVQAYLNSGTTDALMKRRLPQLAGFDNIDETTGFPATGTTVTENLVGFFGSREALLMAARLPAAPPEGSTDVQFENVVDPVTNFPMQFQFFYLPLQRKWVMAIATLFGVLPGPSAHLTRIKSA